VALRAPTPNRVTRVIGSWIISMDNMDQVNAIKTRELEAKGARGFYNFTNFDIENRQTNDQIEMQKKIVLQTRWEDVLIQSLVDSDFKVLSNQGLIEVMGMNYEQYRNVLIAGQDYGARKTRTRLGERIVVLQNVSCAKQEGGLLGYISSTEPVRDVAADFGTISLVFVEIDPCTPGDIDARHLVDKVLGKTEANLFKSMEVNQ
jgi:hypothetical protein